ncbi:hypothetical protein LP420_07135 [Massilia sp. B-10]|nr:hypothetical protein LP420_07135 [Massilia sp. B-10]
MTADVGHRFGSIANDSIEAAATGRVRDSAASAATLRTATSAVGRSE